MATVCYKLPNLLVVKSGEIIMTANILKWQPVLIELQFNCLQQGQLDE